MVYPTYQTSNVLFLVVFAAIVLGRRPDLKPRTQAAMLAVALSASLLGIPWQEYVVNWNGTAAPGKVAEARALLRGLPRANGRILTLAPELVVGTHLALLPGYEMGTFSYFPRMGDGQAERRRVINAARLERDLAERPPSILALSPRALGGFARGIEPHKLRQLIDSRYDLTAVVRGYGQYAEDLYFFSARLGDAIDGGPSRGMPP